MFITGVLSVPVSCAFPDSLSVVTETQIQIPSFSSDAASANFVDEIFSVKQINYDDSIRNTPFRIGEPVLLRYFKTRQKTENKLLC